MKIKGIIKNLIKKLKSDNSKNVSLDQLCCGEGGTLQTNTAGLCGECLWWMDHTGFATAQGGMYFLGPHFLGSRVLCKGTVPSGPCISCTSQVSAAPVLGFSTEAQTLVGCAFCALPRSQQLMRDLVLGEYTVPGELCVLFMSQVLAAWFPRCAVRAQSQIGHVSPLGS